MVGHPLSAGSVSDLFHALSDDVTNHIVRERRGDGEPSGPLGQLESGEPVVE
jgi:hypothetical protein